jgi:putative ABC transport system substrate-binding protein
MRRRKFLAGSGGAVIAWPFAAHAQGASGQKRVGILDTLAENDPQSQLKLTAFSRRLEELGWHDTKNLAITVKRGATGTAPTARAAELLNTAPDVILAVAATSVAALRPISGSIPIVFVQVPDPLGQGFVASFAHPGGNITGFTTFEASIAGKWLDLLKQVARNITEVGLLLDSRNIKENAFFFPSTKEAARILAVTLVELSVQDDSEVDRAIAAFADEPGRGLLVPPSSFSLGYRQRIIAAAQRAALPSMYWDRSFTALGGLVSYGTDQPDNFRRAADYIDRILRGAKPADLPVQAPTKYDLIINMKTAKSLGLTVPQSLLVAADQVIE